VSLLQTTKETIRELMGWYRSGHHDYLVRRRGLVTTASTVGRSNAERAAIIQPILAEAVAGRHVLDVGANIGFFSLQALVHGASRVTSLELDPDHLAKMERLRSRHVTRLAPDAADRWVIRRGDFYEDLVPCDTVMLFGITYHMLRYGMQRGVLPAEGAYRELFQRMAALASHAVIAEWGPPKRPSFESSPYWDEFGYDRFTKGLAEAFPDARCLGSHDYYGAGRENRTRHIHYGAKVRTA
jgi:hypothetical protein